MSHKDTPSPRIRLTGSPIGHSVRIAEFGDEIDPMQRERLHAYGLSDQHPVRVLQQHPMTIVLSEHVELALEHAVARHVWVEPEPHLRAAPPVTRSNSA